MEKLFPENNKEVDMMNFETIIVEKKGHVARITLNRPQRLNAVNSTLGLEMKQALEAIAVDDEVRVLVLTGNPRIREKDGQQEIKHCFSAGWDLSETSPVEPIVEMLAEYEKPVIAMVNGFALGGGCEIALACDFIFVSENAEMGLPEINRGLLPGWGGTQRLPRRIGLSLAKRMIFTGETVNGIEAKDIGLADEVVKKEDLDRVVSSFAEKLAAKPPLGLRKIKSVINKGIDTDLKSGLKLEQEGLGILVQTEDFQEGIAAFMEKREPQWKGR
ncbi:MAG TPA: enoyl-CoA hydratase/isomerase family protein [Candidatus Limnocylindrales bacterium]|nr:enoyl-CoA hydratase/isomerase family protein [Candidatus Limnocylindrales bacterium]